MSHLRQHDMAGAAAFWWVRIYADFEIVSGFGKVLVTTMVCFFFGGFVLIPVLILGAPNWLDWAVSSPFGITAFGFILVFGSAALMELFGNPKVGRE